MIIPIASVASLVLSCIVSVNALKKQYFCTSDYKLEPTIADIVTNLLNNFSVSALSSSHPLEGRPLLQDFNEFIVNNIGEKEVPIFKFISNGLFTINTTAISYNDIFLFQENYYLLNIFCNLPIHESFRLYSVFRSTMCHCYWNSGKLISGKELGLISNANYLDTSFCSYRPCQGMYVINDYCQFKIDPFRKACVRIYSNDIYLDEEPSELSCTSSNEDTFDTSTHLELPHCHPSESQRHSDYDNIVTYNHSIPYLSEFFDYMLQAIIISHERNLLDEENRFNSKVTLVSLKLFSLFIYVSDVIIRFTPVYVCNFFIGSYCYINSDSIAKSAYFQYGLVTLLGFILALMWMIFMFYKATSNLVYPYVPLSNVLLPVIFISGSMLSLGNDYLNIIASNLYSFWLDGSPFGVWWLGKAYFMGSLCFSIFITWFLGLFTTGSNSLEILRYSVKLIGVFILLNSSSSLEISAVMTSVIILKDEIEYLLWSSYLSGQAIVSKPSTFYTGMCLNYVLFP